ncbi:MAG: low molecular weight protein arginine phosphatase [Verrucomicrobiota bacterium]
MAATQVLFICTGNVCRSPMAEGLFCSMIDEKEDIRVLSAGINAGHGHPPSQYSVEVLQDEGLDISAQRSQQLTPELVDSSTHIFTMALTHKLAIEGYFPAAAEKTFLLRELSEEVPQDLVLQGALDVPDPIGQDLHAY